MSKKNYSVLMAVYFNDSPENFIVAVKSILNQTIKPDDVVLVCDGPVGEELEKAISKFQDTINIVRLTKNVGLGNALNEGLKYCKNELVARMDSDDISVADRCEKQMKFFEENPNLTILSSAVSEFVDNPEAPVGIRKVPETFKEIISYSKKRSPFNHPSVMFKKSAVFDAGGYREEYHFFEDYDLWIRMLRSGADAMNSGEVLVNMRVSSEMYKRRGGIKYAKDLLRFHNHLRSSGWISSKTFYTCAVPHAFICVLPNGARKTIYKKLRK